VYTIIQPKPVRRVLRSEKYKHITSENMLRVLEAPILSKEERG
jgi:hypothetical protein